MKKRVALWAGLACAIALSTAPAMADEPIVITPSEDAAPVADEVVPHGVYVGHVDASGMNRAQVEAVVDQLVEELKAQTLTMHSDKGDTTLPVSSMGLVCLNKDAVVNAAMGEDFFGNLIQQYKQEKDLECNNKHLQPELYIEGAVLAQYLVEQIPSLVTAPQNASVKLNDAGEFEVSSSIPGFSIDYDGTYEAVVTALRQFDGVTPLEATVIGQVVPAKYDDSVFDGFGAVLGQCTTAFEVTEQMANRAANVRLAASKINGTVLMPGEEFSFCQAMQPFTEEEGFRPAGTYIDGGTADELGGGVCQVSTTLFDACLYAELNVSFRRPHSKSVSYVDPGMDAMVFVKGGQDFRFVNSTEHAIYIMAYTTPNHKGSTKDDGLTFIIFGTETRDPNRTIWYEGVIDEEKTPESDCGPYQMKYDDSLDMYQSAPTTVVTYSRMGDLAHKEIHAHVVKHVSVNGEEVSADVEGWSYAHYASSVGTVFIHPKTTVKTLEYDERTMVITKFELSNVYLDNHQPEPGAPTAPKPTEPTTEEETTTKKEKETKEPTKPTEPPTKPTEPPTQPTQPTEPPTQPTQPPTEAPTEPPVEPTQPVETPAPEAE